MGTAHRINDEPFLWYCDSISITFDKDVSYYLDYGTYVITEQSDSAVIIQRHQLADSIITSTGEYRKIEDWRTWKLSR